jgi:hypothetical protein
MKLKHNDIFNYLLNEQRRKHDNQQQLNQGLHETMEEEDKELTEEEIYDQALKNISDDEVR